MNPDSILDFGTGLTGFTFRKYLPETPCISVDDSFVWLNRLRYYLNHCNLDSSSLYWYDGQAFQDINTFPVENLDLLIQNQWKARQKVKTYSGDYEYTDSLVMAEPTKRYWFSDVSPFSEIKSWRDVLNCHATSQNWGYHLSPEKHFYLRHPNKEHLKGWKDMGKYTFIHYDFAGMRIRESYLKAVMEYLDRSKDCLMYVDDFHMDEILYQNKKFGQIANEVLASQGGIPLKCRDALLDETGGYGALYYFPPEIL